MSKGEQQIKTILQGVAKKENYALGKIEIQPITSGGANYTTDLYLATISEPLKPDIHIFAKAANLSEDTRQKNEFLAGVYKTEAIFYTELAVNFERLYNKCQVPVEDRLVTPKYYGHALVPYEEVLVLENLETRGYNNYDRMKTFSWEYAATAVTQMAKFHALALALRDENPHEFEKIGSNFKSDFTENQEMMELFLKMALEHGCEGLDDNHKARLHKFFASPENLGTLVKRIMSDEKLLIHGDFRPSNLMHRRRNGKLEIIPVDYQTVRLGNPVADLMHFIFSGSDEEFRRLHYQRLLDHYFTQLTLALRQLKVDVEKVYPRAMFEDDMIEMRPLGLLLGITLAGVLTVAPENAPKMEGDMTSIQVKPNQMAIERISGVVRDYLVRYCNFIEYYPYLYKDVDLWGLTEVRNAYEAAMLDRLDLK